MTLFIPVLKHVTFRELTTSRCQARIIVLTDFLPYFRFFKETKKAYEITKFCVFLPFQLLNFDFPQSGMDIPAAGRNSVVEARRICKYSVVKAIFMHFGTSR